MPRDKPRYILLTVTGKDRSDQRVHTEVFYSRAAADEAMTALGQFLGIAVKIIEDDHG